MIAIGRARYKTSSMLSLRAKCAAGSKSEKVSLNGLKKSVASPRSMQKNCIKFHLCRKSNTYKLLTPISKPRHVNFSNLIVKKYELSRQTHEMTIVSRLKLYKILLYTARIAYKNTYDMRVKFDTSSRGIKTERNVKI